MEARLCLLLIVHILLPFACSKTMKFCVLLSPTKAFAEKSSYAVASSVTSSPLIKPRSILLEAAKKLSKAELKKLMGLSDVLADLNYKRFLNFEEQQNYKPGYLFDGPSFKKLDIHSLNEEELERLDSSLCILSGLYGALKPVSDVMQPYRLEMGTKMAVDQNKNLYQFWEQHGLTQHVATLAKEKIILNCASNEYSKVLNFEDLRTSNEVFDIVFQASSGRLASVYAKQARGLFGKSLFFDSFVTISRRCLTILTP